MAATPPSSPAGIRLEHGSLHRLPVQELDADPRGVVWCWEKPDPAATYVMGIDPTVGIVGWDRALRTASDILTDNGAIEIIRVGHRGEPDRQVLEYAAPIDPEELGEVANILGRLYGGRSDEQQCHSIIEVYPGPGLLTLRRMIARGYTNQFQWSYIDTLAPKPTQSMGWTAMPKTVRDLWIRGRRHILRGGLRINSPWLIEEMADASYDAAKMTARAEQAGQHDDRLRAILLCLWAAHSWSAQVDAYTDPKDQPEPKPEWQATDCSADEQARQWEQMFSEALDE